MIVIGLFFIMVSMCMLLGSLVANAVTPKYCFEDVKVLKDIAAFLETTAITFTMGAILTIIGCFYTTITLTCDKCNHQITIPDKGN